jgi:ABC-type branched-subunit amino acid transport system permease subunit
MRWASWPITRRPTRAVATWPFLIEGTKSMPVIWAVAIAASALAALVIGLLSLRTTGVYFIMITLAFGQMFYFFTLSWAALWRRGRAADLSAQRLSRVSTRSTRSSSTRFALGCSCCALWLAGGWRARPSAWR